MWLDFIGINPKPRHAQRCFHCGGGGLCFGFVGFFNVTHENCISNIILIFLCICLTYCSSGSCQLISTCAASCSEQLRPRRWQRKPVLTRSKFFELSQSQTEPGKFKTTTLLYNEVSHFNKHYQLDQHCIKISPIIWAMFCTQICLTLWLATTKELNALCLWSIVFFSGWKHKVARDDVWKY